MQRTPDLEGNEADDAKNLLTTLALGAAGNINPVAAIFGGVVGQEVIKACSGKYTPLQQWLHFESAHCLPRLWTPEHGPPLARADVAPRQSRYDGQIATLGQYITSKYNIASPFQNTM